MPHVNSLICRVSDGAGRVVGADNPVTAADLVTYAGRGGQVRHLAARGSRGRALSLSVSLRFAYLVVLQMFKLARVARPVRPGQRRGDPDLAAPGRAAPAPGQDSAAVPGRAAGPGRAEPALPAKALTGRRRASTCAASGQGRPPAQDRPTEMTAAQSPPQQPPRRPRSR